MFPMNLFVLFPPPQSRKESIILFSLFLLGKLFYLFDFLDALFYITSNSNLLEVKWLEIELVF